MAKQVKHLFGVVLFFLYAQHVYADVSDIRIWQSPDNVRLVIDLSRGHEHKIFQLKNPDRIVIDLQDAKLKMSLDQVENNSTEIIRLRDGVVESDERFRR
mgnify:FL=1